MPPFASSAASTGLTRRSIRNGFAQANSSAPAAAMSSPSAAACRVWSSTIRAAIALSSADSAPVPAAASYTASAVYSSDWAVRSRSASMTSTSGSVFGGGATPSRPGDVGPVRFEPQAATRVPSVTTRPPVRSSSRRFMPAPVVMGERFTVRPPGAAAPLRC